MSKEEGSGGKTRKDWKIILKEERLKKEKPVEIWKIGVDGSNDVEKKEKLLKKVIVKIELK